MGEFAELGLGNKCNNCCVMCTSILPLQGNYLEPTTEDIFRLIDSYDDNLSSLLITGGEPTIRKDFFKILSYIRTRFPNVEIKLISNGRLYSNENFVSMLETFSPINYITELHASNSFLHDKITQVQGSFQQTYLGIKNLLKLEANLELRIVISKNNYKDLQSLLSLYAFEFSQVSKVVIFPIDLVGNAYRYKEQNLISFKEFIPHLQNSLDLMASNFPDFSKKIKLFHVPYCVINEKYWGYIEGVTVPIRRIDLMQSCESCSKRNSCPLVWKTYVNIVGTEEFKPI